MIDIKTEGIKYIGSKQKILPYIYDLIVDLNIKTVFDIFSGSTRVSQLFNYMGYNVICNDIAYYSEVFANCYLLNNKSKENYLEMINYLNNLKPISGWFTETYSDKNKKQPFQVHNLMKLDSVRNEIDNLSLNVIEKSVLITSLILALDKVDNTLGHFASYSYFFSDRSYNTMNMILPNLTINFKNNKVMRNDILDISKNIITDLTYIDPPYGSNNDKMPSSRVRYNQYYHFYNTVVLNDKPDIFGKVGRRLDTKNNSSIFDEYKKSDNQFIVYNTIEKMLNQLKCKYILFSYSNNGRIPINELIDLLSKQGNILKNLSIDHKNNVMQNMVWTKEFEKENKQNKEFLILVEKKLENEL